MTYTRFFRLFVLFVLVYSVINSKHLIIYNEEILVTLCSIGFVYFIQRMYSVTIREFIDEKGDLTAQEYENSVTADIQQLVSLVHLYQTIATIDHSVSLIKDKTLAEFSSFSKEQQTLYLQKEHQLKLNNTFKKLVSLRKGSNKMLQDKIADEFLVFAQKNLKAPSLETQKRQLIQTLNF